MRGKKPRTMLNLTITMIDLFQTSLMGVGSYFPRFLPPRCSVGSKRRQQRAREREREREKGGHMLL